VTPEALYLLSLGQALATMGLYPGGHPARERAIDASLEQLLAILADVPSLQFSFLGGESIVGQRPMSELPGWEWASKLSAVQIERIEFDAGVTPESYLRFVDDIWNQLSGTRTSTAEGRQLVYAPARFGVLQLARPVPERGASPGAAHPEEGPFEPVSLADEVAAIEWMQQEAARGAGVPIAEAEAVVGSLSLTMHSERRLLLPLLAIKEFDQYTLTHSCNVAVLSIGLGERVGLDTTAVRAMGVSGLLHDIGKIRIPRDVLIKPGAYTAEDRAVMQRHPVDGARIILAQEGASDVAAVVAYEHHLYLDGGGYPSLRFARGADYASRIVHVCDIYDALCTHRPYRKAWAPAQALEYLEKQAGTELEPELVNQFAGMIRESNVSWAPLANAEAEPDPAGRGPAVPPPASGPGV
jgi:putative nucleotidyltransferase with HDIG domain